MGTIANFQRQLLYRRLFIILVTCVLIFLLCAMFIFQPDPAVAVVTDLPYNFTLRKGRFAYVQYVTSPHYICYAAVNVHRLIFDVKADPSIDVVLLATETSGIRQLCPMQKCPFPQGRVKIKMVSKAVVETSRKLAHDDYYKDCHVRLDAFSLYKDYDRIVIMDADGLIMRNLDHLFQTDLGNYSLAATFAYYEPQHYISTVLMVIDLSKALYDQVRSYFTPKKLDEIAVFNYYHNHYDMDIINHMFKRGNLTKLLPKHYALMDTYFFANDKVLIPSRESELNLTYYIHFWFTRKPLAHIEMTRPRQLQIMLSNSSEHANAPSIDFFTRQVYYPFWKLFDRYCSRLLPDVKVPKMSSDSD